MSGISGLLSVRTEDRIGIQISIGKGTHLGNGRQGGSILYSGRAGFVSRLGQAIFQRRTEYPSEVLLLGHHSCQFGLGEIAPQDQNLPNRRSKIGCVLELRTLLDFLVSNEAGSDAQRFEEWNLGGGWL